MFEGPQQLNKKEETKEMKLKEGLKKFGKALMLATGLLIGAQNTEAGIKETKQHSHDMFKEMDKEMGKEMGKEMNETKKNPSQKEEKLDKLKNNAESMFEAMDALEVLDIKYRDAKNEKEKDLIRQEIAKEVLMSGRSKKILFQKNGVIKNMRVGDWIIEAQTNGEIVTGTIVSGDPRYEKEKSMFAFTLR